MTGRLPVSAPVVMNALILELFLCDHGDATLPIALSNLYALRVIGASELTTDLGKDSARTNDAVPRHRGGAHAAIKTSPSRRMPRW